VVVAVDGDRLVFVAGERPLLTELVYGHLGQREFNLPRRTFKKPADMVRAVPQLRAAARAATVVVCDPLGDAWTDAVRQLRGSEPVVGTVILAVRTSFGSVRRWREATNGRHLASALLSLDNDLEQLADAVEGALASPGQTDFWPDGPRHPARFWGTTDGEVAHKILFDASHRHTTLTHIASGKSVKEVALMLEIRDDQVRRHLTWLKDQLGVRSDVQLGRRALELGLLDELLEPV
jgi:DNA-binding NarL/FixJ family response regulator